MSPNEAVCGNQNTAAAKQRCVLGILILKSHPRLDKPRYFMAAEAADPLLAWF